MIGIGDVSRFDWDKGNIDKNYLKHGITPNEAEEVFLDKDVLILEDINHSENEERLMTIGKTSRGNILFLAFTKRKDKIRIISARKSNKKERRQYEENI